MKVEDYLQLDALALGGLIASGQLQPAEVLRAARERAEAVNPDINAITEFLDQIAEKMVGQLAGGSGQNPTSLLAGVPFLLKDLHLDLAGARLTNGSRLFADSPPAQQNSTLTQRYLDAGLVVFGRTNTPEFGATVTTEPVLFGPTRNPFDTGYSAGGSSGGAAAAVAAGIVPAAHASDGGGSIRIPANCCGLFGLKPSRGRTPAGPLRGEGWNGQSINHVVSRTVRDSACLLDVSAGAEPGDPYAAPASSGTFLQACAVDPGPLRIAFSVAGPGQAQVDSEVADAVKSAAELCERLGHQIEEAAPPVDVRACGQALLVVIFTEIRALLTALQSERGQQGLPGLDEVERANLASAGWAQDLSAEDLLSARNAMHQAGRVMGQFHQQYDLYLCPVLAQPTAPIGFLDMNSEDEDTYRTRLAAYTPFTALFNQTGQPSASIPLGTDSKGLPIGTMFTAAMGNDELLFSLAAQLERAAPWSGRYPFCKEI